MGFLAKRTTKKLMSADAFDTALSKDAVLDAVQSAVDGLPAPKAELGNKLFGESYRYAVLRGSDAAQVVLETYKNKTGETTTGRHDRRFTVDVNVRVNQVAGRSEVTVVTSQCVTADDAIADKKRHEQVRAGLATALRQADSTIRQTRSREDKS